VKVAAAQQERREARRLFRVSLTMTSRLHLHLSAKDLKNLSGFMGKGKADPFAVVTVRGDSQDNPPIVVGQTDV
jgi:hypothetical protein